MLKALRETLIPPPHIETHMGREITILMRGSDELQAVIAEVKLGKGKLDNVQMNTLNKVCWLLAKAERMLGDD